MRDFLKLFFPVLFLGALAMNGALTLLGWQAPSRLDENRELARWPQWSDGLTSYVRGLDAWLIDNFALRKPLVAAYSEILYYGLRSTLNPRVIIGRGPWIFGADFDGQGSVTPRQLSDDYLKRIRLAIIERRDWLAERGTEMVVVFMPTKTNVYGPRYLPWGFSFNEKASTESEQVYEQLGPTLRAVFTPVREAMITASEHQELYYHTDGHANQQGTFVAFQRLAQDITSYHPMRAPDPYPDYELKLDYYEPTSFGRLMGIPFRDESLIPVPLGGHRFVEGEAPAAVEFLPPGSQAVFYQNSHVRDVSAALIGDSFTDRMAAIFGDVFRSSTIVQMNNVPRKAEMTFPTAYLDAARPDFAVFMYVESRLVECEDGCGEFPLQNPDDVRQARLRRLFSEASPVQDGERLRIAEISNDSLQALTVSSSSEAWEIAFEMRTMRIPAGKSSYIILDEGETPIYRTDAGAHADPPVRVNFRHLAGSAL